jgi:hypothetical protein
MPLLSHPLYPTQIMKTHTRLHTFVGQAGTQAIDGFAGFHIGKTYELRYRREDRGAVVIELDHLRGGGQVAITAAEFEAWFRK